MAHGYLIFGKTGRDLFSGNVLGTSLAVLCHPPGTFTCVSHVQFVYISGEHFWKNALIFRGQEEPLIRCKYCMNDPFEMKCFGLTVVITLSPG